MYNSDVITKELHTVGTKAEAPLQASVVHVEQWSTIPKVVSLGHRLSLYLEYPPCEYAHPLSTIYSPRSEKKNL